MKIWYLADVHDEYELCPADTVFYATQKAASDEWHKIETDAQRNFYANQEKIKERWETDEEVVKACERAGIDWRNGRLMYHKRIWSPAKWYPSTKVKSIEVVE